MPRLPDTWLTHLQQGVVLRIGSSTAAGEPEICRGLAIAALPDGRIEVLIQHGAGALLLAAIAGTGRIAVSAGLPTSYRVLHIKGRDAELLPLRPEHGPLFTRCFDAFVAQLAAYGTPRAQIDRALGPVSVADLSCVRFTPFGAWDQTPGPGAGQPVDLLP